MLKTCVAPPRTWSDIYIGVSRLPKAVKKKWFSCWLVLRVPSKPVYVGVHSNTANAVDSGS